MGGRYTLGKPTVYGSTLPKSLIKRIRDHRGTLLLTRPTSSAFVLINKAGLPAYLHLIGPCLPLYLFHLTVGQKLYVGMSTDIQHLGRQDSDGTVVGGKGLVQLRHFPADAGQFFHQVDPNAHFGKVQRCLDAGDAAADD